MPENYFLSSENSGPLTQSAYKATDRFPNLLQSEKQSLALNPAFQKLHQNELRQELAINRENRLSRQAAVAENLAYNKEQFEREKWMMNKFIDLYSKARSQGDMALQSNLMSQGNSFINAISPQSKQLLKPILESSPFSPFNQRLAEYDQRFPMPNITADMDKDPYLYARQAWDKEDAEARREAYATGKSPRKRTLIALDADKDRFSYRDNQGRIHTASSDTLQLQGFADRTNSSIGEVLAHGGAYIGDKRTTVVNGHTYESRTFLPYGESQAKIETISKGKTPELRAQEKGRLNFQTNYGLDEPTDELAALVKRYEDDGWDRNEIFDKVVYPHLGVSYRLIEGGKKKQKLFPWLPRGTSPPLDALREGYTLFTGIGGNKQRLQPIPGKPYRYIENDPNSTVFYDAANDSVRDEEGIYLGTMEEARRKLKKIYED